MHQDFKELLSAFNAGQVRYLIVGGYAVSFHAQPRATKDLDILIGADAENSKAVYTAPTPWRRTTPSLHPQRPARLPAGSVSQPRSPPVRWLKP
jgi:hypothetical protein